MSQPTYEELEQKVREIEQKLDQVHSAEKAHPGSNDILRLLDFAPYGLFLIDVTGKIIAANKSGAERLGKTVRGIIGMTFRELLSADVYENRRRRVAEAIKSGKPVSFEDQIQGRWYDTTIFPIFDNLGHVTSLAIFGRDVTTYRLMEEARRESEKKYRLLVENASEVVLVAQDGWIRFVNRKAFDLIGYNPEELIGKAFGAYIHPDDRETIADRHMKRIKGEKAPPVYPFRVIDKAGEIKWVEIKAIRIDWEGKPATLNLLSDITERKRAEDALKESEARLRSIIEHSNEMFFFHDTNHLLLYVSPQAEVIFGYGHNENRTKWTDFITENPLNLIGIELTEKAIRTGERQEPYLLELRRKDGGIVLLEIDESPVKDAYGKVIAITGAARDVTLHKKAEQELHAEKERLRILVEKSPLGISLIGEDGHYKYLNPKFIEIFGYTLEDIPAGKEWFRRAYPDKNYRKEVIATWLDDRKRYGIGEARARTYRATCKDGSKKVIYFRTVSMETGDQLVFYEDITEIQHLEEQLRQSQKMEAIGTLAGGIAHDFNNLLQAIMGYAQMIMMDKEEGDADLGRLREIEKAGQRAGQLTKQLLTFSRKVESKLRPVDLNQEVWQVEGLLKRIIPKMITIELHLEEGLKVINADPAQVEQIMMNLGVNARDAMPEGGRLVIETETINLDKEYCRAHLGAVPGEYVLLSISDTGSGMDKETVEHIFEPFYTTKEADKGTGLGLSMVYGIVKSHGGYIMCYSEPGEGTTFKIYLPAIETVSIEYGAKREEQEEIQGGSETILLVDDEVFLQDLGKELLGRFGYTVLIADRGESALEIYKKKRDEISLVILDIIMPGMGGKKCLEELLRMNPLVKVVFTSGYSINGPTREAPHAGAKGFINKPYELRQMLKVVREALDLE